MGKTVFMLAASVVLVVVFFGGGGGVTAEKPIAFNKGVPLAKRELMRRFLAALEEKAVEGESTDVISLFSGVEKREKKGPPASKMPRLTAEQIMAKDFSNVKDKTDQTKHHTIDEKLGGVNDEKSHAKRAEMEKRLAIQDAYEWGYWKNGMVPYEFGYNFMQYNKQEQVYSALKDIMKYTCIKFEPFSQGSSDAPRISFQDKGQGCYSFVGMGPQGPQEVELADGCMYHSTILHETIHALGVHHTQTRFDRDQFITVHFDRIEPDNRYAFRKISASQSFGTELPYDYLSVMHYGPYGFSVTGDPTITTKSSCYQNQIGNTNVLSFNDVKLLNAMYKCGEACPADSRCQSPCFLAKNGNSGSSCECICPKADSCGGNLALGSVTNMGTGTNTGTGTITTTTKSSVSDCYTLNWDGAAVYTGTKSETAMGPCTRWDGIGYTEEEYPYAGLESNYCRNPDNDIKPWCPISGGWEYCDIPQCS